MKLKATFGNVDLFLRVIQTLEKTGKQVLLHLTPKEVFLIVRTDLTDGGMQVWCGLKPETLFSLYRIVSLSGNEISFTLQLDNLSRALKSGPTNSRYTMKLTKKGNAPYLKLTVTPPGATVATVSQDVPVEMLTQQELHQYKEPDHSNAQVNILMPPLKTLRSVIDRMRAVSEHVTISANLAGAMTFSVDTDMVSIATHYKNLPQAQLDGQPPLPSNPAVRATAKLDLRKFSRVLYS